MNAGPEPDGRHVLECRSFPFEFSVPLATGVQALGFRVAVVGRDGGQHEGAAAGEPRPG